MTMPPNPEPTDASPPSSEADQDDTGPVQIVEPNGAWVSNATVQIPSPPPEQPAHPWAAGHVGFPPPATRVSRRKRGALLGAAGVAALLVAGGVTLWLRQPAPEPPASTAEPATTTTTRANVDPEQQARLLALVPDGYPTGACSAGEPPQEAIAILSCTNNTDPGGPTSATYTLFRDKSALTNAFDHVVHTSAVVVCPGNYQSPGPWRRNATPDRSAGMLVCGQQQSLPMVAWTTDEEQMLSVVRSKRGGPNLEQLYAWWSTHS